MTAQSSEEVEFVIGRIYLRTMILIGWQSGRLGDGISEQQLLDLADVAALICQDANFRAPSGPVALPNRAAVGAQGATGPTGGN